MERFRLAQPTRYPLQQVVADAAQRFGRKKAIEVGQVHRFLDELGMPDDGVLVAGETPDFTYHTAGRRIGIEIRKLFRNKPIEDAARRERIVTQAQGLAAGDGRWMLAPLRDAERRDLNEVIEDRAERASTLIASQLPVTDWHAVIGDPNQADAICDRLLHDAHRIDLKGHSMRRTHEAPANRPKKTT